MSKKKQLKQKDSSEKQDDRFAKVYTDPRFMVAPNKVKKVQIDSRFKSMMEQKSQFNMVAPVDKYGRKVNKQDQLIKDYYQIKDQDSEESDNDQEQVQEKAQPRDAGSKFYDEDGKFHWSQSSSDDDDDDDGDEEGEAEMIESQEESQEEKVNTKSKKPKKQDQDDSDDLSGVWSLDEPVAENDKDNKSKVDESIVSRRLAVTNLDWDNISAVDLFSLFNSFCQGDMLIQRVDIFPSLYGIEQMKNDSTYGPPKEMFKSDGAKQAKKMKRKRKEVDHEFISDEEFQLNEQDDEVNLGQLRKYEANKMKYFFGVVTCNKPATADKIYKEYQGFEFELTNLTLNLSYIPEDMEIPQKVKESATEVPIGNYEFDPSRISRAMNHSTVKLTWDQTDPKRTALLTKASRITATSKKAKVTKKKPVAMNSDDDSEMEGADDDDAMSDDQYMHMIAGSSEDEYDEEDDVQENEQTKQLKLEEQARIEERRQKLLGSLSGKTSQDMYRQKALQNDSDSDNDDDQSEQSELDIKFGIGFNENIGKKLIDEKNDKMKKAKMSEFEKWQDKKKEKKRSKKQEAKQKKQIAKQQGALKNPEDDINQTEKARKERAALEMLVTQENNGVSDYKGPDKSDSRFAKFIDQGGEYAQDPTHKDFRKLQGQTKIIKRPKKY